VTEPSRLPGPSWLFWTLLISPVPVFVVSMMLGTYGASPPEVVAAVWARLTGQGQDISVVVMDIRLPRVVASLLVGGAVATAGAVLQGVLRNPLVDPFVLGLSSGGAFGAALSIAVLPWLPVQVSAFAFALAALGLSYGMARVRGAVPIVNLVLSGVITSAVFTALLSIVEITAHERSLQAIVLWTMGSFNGVTWAALQHAWWPIVLGCGVLIALRWRLNVLAMGDDEARSAGLPVERYKAVFIVGAALVSACAVALCGVVALLGLIVPHMVRMVIGPDHRILVPASAALGASLLALVDDVARSAFGFEIPVSIITTLIGAPFFWLLLRSTKAGRWQ
jgi:iron complex transport system permease protein